MSLTIYNLIFAFILLVIIGIALSVMRQEGKMFEKFEKEIYIKKWKLVLLCMFCYILGTMIMVIKVGMTG